VRSDGSIGIYGRSAETNLCELCASPREAEAPVPVIMGAKKYRKPELNPFAKVNFA
jgi:hypothetical protein